MDAFQPIPVIRSKSQKRGSRHPIRTLFLALLLVYFIGPLRTNILLLGTDASDLRGPIGRTDTIILTTMVPTLPYVGMMGIPRDLWLPIPEIGEQRINTAYFYGEYSQPGTGPAAIMATVEQNFDVPVHYYALIRMAGLVDVIDALGGVDIALEHKAGGLKSGEYHLNGSEALAFARERYSSDDFSRMQQGQLLIRGIATKMMNPTAWPQLPVVLIKLSAAVDTNIPFWQWPRLVFCMMRVSWLGVDARTISADMVFPFTTSGGAQVLAPNWDAIHAYVKEMFGN
jgi:LCP family protein required for cell wall assembly